METNYPSKIIFWVWVLDIPLQYWAAQSFRSIGDALGRVHGDVDMVEGRVRVEVDGFQPLVFTMTVDFDEGIEIPISLRYEKLVGYCKECFRLTHDQSRCPTLMKTVEEGSSMAGYEDQGANVNSYKTAVLNGREQLGERREGQQSQFQNGREGFKGKGVARDKTDDRAEAFQYKPKSRYHRGNGEDASLHGRQAGHLGPRDHDRGMAPQTRNQQQTRYGEERQHLTNQEKLMLDAFKGAERSPQPRAFASVALPVLEGSSSTSKARKLLLFEEVPEAENVKVSSNLSLETQVQLEEKDHEDVTASEMQGKNENMVTKEAREDSTLMEDGTVFDDSDMLVDTEDMQEWEHGEIPEFAEEEAGGAVEEAGNIEEESCEQAELSVEQGDNQERAPKKMGSRGGALAMGGNSKKWFVQSIISPRKKLLAKAIAKTGQVKKIPAKAKTSTE